MKKKAYLFDFDGTLVDTMSSFADLAGKIINEFHPEISFKQARARYLETSGIPFYQQLEIIYPDDPSNPEKTKRFEEGKKTIFFNEKFSDEVRETIENLKGKGHFVGVSSNNFKELLDLFIEREGLKFDTVLGFRTSFEKGRDHFVYLGEQFNFNWGEDVIFVGDSLKDAEKALSNGVEFIGLCGTFKREDFKKIDKNIKTVDRFSEILNL